MITKTTIAAALISLTTLAAVPAQASDVSIQIGFGGSGYGWSDGHGGHGYGHHRRVRQRIVSPDEVRWMLRDRGYHHINFMGEGGRVYKLHARKHGDRYFFIVSSRTGEILARNRF